MVTRRASKAGLLGLAAAASLWLAAGCFHNADECAKTNTCPPDGSTGAGGDGGGATTFPVDCIPSNSAEPVANKCGVFVSAAGDDGNDGKKETPKKTLSAAINASSGRPIYACTDGLKGPLAPYLDVTIYGGLDCKQGWRYVGLETKTPWMAEPGEVVLRLTGDARVTLSDVAIAAADAIAPGGSSVAVVAEAGTQLSLARCDVTAGNGADGAAGETPDTPTTSGIDGNAGKNACADMDQLGGSAAVLSCDSTVVSSGAGGIGTTSDGGAGSPGKPAGPMGTGGTGQDSANACTPGGDGAPGASGEPGLGAPMSLGTLGPSGPAGVSGTAGGAGKPGQGGGGGGGGKACLNGKAGASGGSGGSGGCGGAGGKGGRPGGSSVAIVSLGAKLTLDTVSIVTKAGGKGGDGGEGQPGGAGGKAGLAGSAQGGSTACSGGPGGPGGPGGKGGGGLGGHSLGIAYIDEAPDVKGATITTGTGGKGGEGEGADGQGTPGVAAKTKEF